MILQYEELEKMLMGIVFLSDTIQLLILSQKTGNTYQCFFYEDPDDNITKAKMPIIYSSYDELIKNKGFVGTFYMTEDDGKIYKWNGKEYEIIDIGLTNITTSD